MASRCVTPLYCISLASNNIFIKLITWQKKIKTKTKTVIANNSLEFLKEYINTPSPVGFESSGQKVWLNYIKNFVDTTFYRSLWNCSWLL